MPEKEKNGFSRRGFLKLTGAAALGLGLDCGFTRILLADNVFAIPASKGYLLVDAKKCAGCMSCMLACSLANEGKENLSFSRIQILTEPFEPYPGDIIMSQCRQCISPACLEECPVDAIHADKKHGYVRTIDAQKCIGCMECVEACPFVPSRSVWNYEQTRARKCDLCAESRYWEEKGGPEGKQACVQVCPMSAITFTDQIPDQNGDAGYAANLRGETWAKLGFEKD